MSNHFLFFQGKNPYAKLASPSNYPRFSSPFVSALNSLVLSFSMLSSTIVSPKCLKSRVASLNFRNSSWHWLKVPSSFLRARGSREASSC